MMRTFSPEKKRRFDNPHSKGKSHLINMYGSIFAAFLPAQVPVWTFVVLLPAVFAIEAGWYTIVAVVLSADPGSTLYLPWKNWFDRAGGAVMGTLGCA